MPNPNPNPNPNLSQVVPSTYSGQDEIADLRHLKTKLQSGKYDKRDIRQAWFLIDSYIKLKTGIKDLL